MADIIQSIDDLIKDKNLAEQVAKLHDYYTANPGMRLQTIDSGNQSSAAQSMHQALSGSNYTPEHLGITWPLLLGGILQSDLVKKYNTGEIDAKTVQSEAYKLKETHPYLHNTFVSDVLRNIGYSQDIKDNKIQAEPIKNPQGYINNTDYLDINRG